jgi:hypothetical protein
MGRFASKLELMEIEAASWYMREGICELTKKPCDYEGVGGKGYCDGCCRAG